MAGAPVDVTRRALQLVRSQGDGCAFIRQSGQWMEAFILPSNRSNVKSVLKFHTGFLVALMGLIDYLTFDTADTGKKGYEGTL